MITQLSAKLKSLALAEAILMPDWEDRYFSYNSHWDAGEEMASMRNGSGGEWFLWISGEKAAYKCYSPEDGKIDNIDRIKLQIPAIYESFINEPAFSIHMATSIWYLDKANWIQLGLPVEGLIDLKTVSKWTAKDYQIWAAGYYEQKISLPALEKIFKGEYTYDAIRALNPERDLKHLQTDISEIGIDIQ